MTCVADVILCPSFRIIVNISDSGPGIPQNKYDDVFKQVEEMDKNV